MKVFAESRIFRALLVVGLSLLFLACGVQAQQNPAASLPSLSSSGGTYTTQQQVYISTQDLGVTLRYTLNGSAPTSGDLPVPQGAPVLITQSTTLKVAGFSGTTSGSVATAVFNITGQAAAGAHSSVILKSDGSIWTSGDNSSAQLGNGSFVATSSPVQVPNLSGFISVASGYYHVLALKDDGTVWAWGLNWDGELGNGTALNAASSPVQVTSLSGVVAIAAGGYHSLALKSDGTVWAWGLNVSGALGTGGTQLSRIPLQVSGLTGIKAIAAGYLHSLALKADGSVWGFGNNADGELALGNTINSLSPQQAKSLGNITAMAAGRFHSVFLKGDGTVWACGYNGQGQLGNNSTTNSSLPVQASGLTGVTSLSSGFFFSTALKANGSVWAWGENTFQELGNLSLNGSTVPVQVANVSSALAITSQGHHSLAVLTNGAVLSWGANFSGDFGTGTAATQTSPVAIAGLNNIKSVSGGGFFSLLLKSDGTVWSWGNNPDGELGNGTTNSTNVPTQIAALSTVAQVAAGGFHGVALKTNGTVWTWGFNGYCELGNGTQISSLSPVQVSGLAGVTAVAAGQVHTLALKSDGSVWAWGYNADGELGNGTSNNISPTPTQVSGLGGVVAICAGYFHSMALKNDGTVWVWGANSNGQLGNGSTLSSSVPVKVASLSGITSIAAGFYHNSALRGSDKTVWCWGYNGEGELGNGSLSTGLVPTQVAGLTGATSISGGAYHTFAFVGGNAYGWGFNLHGQLGNGLNLENRTTPSVVLSAGSLPLTGISAGAYHSFGTNSTLGLYAWGSNFNGQLGLGSTGATYAPVLSGFVAVAMNQAPPAPSNLMVNYNGVSQATLTWSQSGSLAQSFTIQQSNDGGASWVNVSTIAGNLTSYVVTNIPSGSSVKFRIIANGSYSSSGASVAASALVGMQITGGTVAPATLSFSVTVSAAAGAVSKVDFYEGAKLLGSLTTPPYTASLPNVMAGPHTFTAIARSANGVVGQGSALVTVTMPPDALAQSRFSRGPGVDLNFQTFVLSIDRLAGIGLDLMGNNATKFPLGLPWFERVNMPTLYQVANTKPTTYPTAFQNPLVAFGAAGGGTPLYINQAYRFALGSGGQIKDPTFLDFRISVFAKSQFATTQSGVNPVYTYTVSLPKKGSADWNTFAQSGFVRTIDLTAAGYPLVTKIQFVSGASVADQFGQQASSPFLLTHTAASSAFCYRIDYAGTTFANGQFVPMTASVPATSPTYGYGYTLDFSERAPWISTFISQPHFDSVTMPSEYAGKSINELLKVSFPVTYQFAPPAAELTILDRSPELRSHPVLDKFVADMGANPIALTNYVFNQIQLTDALSYNDTGAVNETSINPGGVNRSALGTFLEKQGSPTEQCALLIYLLRKAGVPCAYVFPTHNTLQMLDSRMSKLLRMQLKGAVDAYGNSNVPQLLNVNYPWVALYLNNQWVHVFPWLKDTAINEGYNLADCLPTGTQTGLQWLQKYINRDSGLLGLSAEFDNPGKLYPLYVTQQLALKGLSLNDVGVTICDRQNNRDTWSDFPQPWQVAPGSLAASNLVASLSAMPTIFDTIQCLIYSDRNNNGKYDAGEPLLDTGTLRAVDLHNRRLMVKTVKTAPNAHSLFLTLEPLRPGSLTITEPFTPNGQAINKQSLSVALGAADDALSFRTIYNRHRTLPTGFTAPAQGTAFLGVSDLNQVVDERPLRKGDLAVLCLNYGRVTQEMLNVQAQNFWSAQQAVLANPATVMDADVAAGTPLLLLGMTYYKQVSDFRAWLEPLQKQNVVSFFAHGFSKMSPQRNADGSLPNNGDINPIYPNVDMMFQRMASAGNGTLHPDSGLPDATTANDWLYLLIGEVSAQEHTVINKFFNVSDTASTVHLLHAGQTQGKGLVSLTSQNYAAAGSVSYTLNGVTKTLQAWAGPSMWGSITQLLTPYSSATNTGNVMSDYALVYVTPGPIICANKAYQGLGAFLFNPGYSAAALISGNMLNVPLNGGYGQSPSPLDVSFYSTAKAQNYTLTLNGDTPTFDLKIASNVDNGSNNTALFSAYILALSNGTTIQSVTQQNAVTLGSTALNVTSVNTGFAKTGDLTFGLDNIGWIGATSSFADNDAKISKMVADPVNAVTGGFYINETDLLIPGPLPIQLARNYDSLNLASNEFGAGWKMGYFSYLSVATDSSVIYAAEMDGSVVAYRLQTGSATRWVPTAGDNPNLSNQQGDSVGSIYNLFNNRIDKVTSGGTVTYTLSGVNGSVRTFVVASYPSPGAKGLTRQRPYLQKWVDPQGNYLNFTFGNDPLQPDFGFLNRIASSNGNFVQLNYDIYGHIISANAADGRRVFYSYDSFGDLVSVTRPDASVVQYGYSHKPNTGAVTTGFYSEHLLIQESKPAGRILANTYDDQRRVTQQKATVGLKSALTTNASFQYTNAKNSDGTLTGTTLVADAFNRTTRYDYAGSQITKVTDPLNQTVQTVWYAPGDISAGAYQRSLKQHIDKRGLSVLYKYDARGNLIQTDTTGNLTGSGSSTAIQTTTYNALNLPAQINEPNGNFKKLFYASPLSPYLLTSVQRSAPAGLTSQTDYSYTNAGITGTVPFANGLLQKVTQAVGTPDQSSVSYTYNNSGFPTSETRPTGTTDPAVSFAMSYNLRGQLLKKTDAAGQWSGFAYDDLGNAIWQERHDTTGALVAWNYQYYNANGEVEWTQGSRYNPDDYTMTRYDGAGRILETLQWRSEAMPNGAGVQAAAGDAGIATTSNQFDAFGNLVKTLNPRGTATSMSYDAIGQLLTSSQSDASGSTLSSVSFTYEPGGKVSKQTNPLGGVSLFSYTQSGQPLTRQNADGTTQQWLYLPDGRLSKETFPNGSNRAFAYDDFNRTVTSFLRDASGNLLATEIQSFDRRGNLIQKNDAEGFITSTTYDALNRVVLISGPPAVSNSAQQKVTHHYDAAGLRHTETNALGEQTITVYDAEARPVKIEILSANGFVVRSTSYLYAPDHQSVVRVQGLPGANTTTFTDLQGKPILVWNADGTGTLSRYDVVGNLLSTTDELGRTTLFAYDGLNRLTQQILPDGASLTFTYDASGNLLKRQMPGNIIWNATYDAASRKLTEKLTQNTSVTRATSYTYNLAGNGVGQLATFTNPRGIVSSVSYDALGRQTQVVALDSSAAQAGVTRSFGYDRRNLLKQIDQAYQNPALSPSTSVKRTYDGYGALVTEQTYVAGVLKDNWQQTHDSAGRRILLTELNNPALPFTYKYQADGNLIETDFNNSAYFYEYKIDGRLYSRNTPLHAQGLGRDWSGRIVEAGEYVGGSLVLNEKIAWRADSTQSSNAITRIGGTAWSESRSYNYDLRGRLISESFTAKAGVTGSAGYQFDSGAPGGIGVRTGVTLAGNLSGIQTGTYNAFAQLSSLGATGNLSGALSNPLNQTFDPEGNVITRLRSGGNDTLSWDALGRLISVTRRNAGNSGLNWSAVYDGLGRRLQTTQQTVTGGALSGSALTLKSAYDPDVEFLEVSATLGTTRNWLVHGPDLNGVYGGLQGTGGLEAVYNAATGLTTGIVSDNSGHAAATFTSGNVFTWNPVAVTGYGAAPGSIPAPPLDATRDFASFLAWRGHYLDCTGFYYMGMRYYDPESATFLSADPMGHPASLSLYDYCNGDPVNRVDPDGRVAKVAAQGVRVTGEDADQLTQSMVEGIGILKVIVVGSGAQKNATLQTNIRYSMAQQIVNFEARRDRQGYIQVYKLPSNDGGGSYEVAGINDRYHPEAASELRNMIQSGNPIEAEKLAVNYIQEYTRGAEKWTTQLGVESYLRDTIFNRGAGGAVKVLQIALGLSVDGGMGPITRRAVTEAENNPVEFLEKLRRAREKYEDIVAPGRPNLRPGLINRWNNALDFSKKIM